LSNQEQNLFDKQLHCGPVFYHLDCVGKFFFFSWLSLNAESRGKPRYNNGNHRFSRHPFYPFKSPDNHSSFHKSCKAPQVASPSEGSAQDEQSRHHCTRNIFCEFFLLSFAAK
jgi:hypothetical protein